MERWKYTESQGRKLPGIELGHFHWHPSWNEVLCFPIVVKRERRVEPDLDVVNGGAKRTSLELIALSLSSRHTQSKGGINDSKI